MMQDKGGFWNELRIGEQEAEWKGTVKCRYCKNYGLCYTQEEMGLREVTQHNWEPIASKVVK